MDTFSSLARALAWADYLAIVFFFAAWAGYALFARRHSTLRPSVLASTNRERERWMLQMTRRANRVIDGQVAANLATSPSFFASTTILIIGALLAVLSSTDRASEIVREMPFAARNTTALFDLKLVLLLAIFVFAFFRFTWSLRQYSFGAILVGAAPEHYAGEAERAAEASRAGRVMGLAAEAFNDGLRAYYFAFAALAFFVSPWAMAAATLVVVVVLYRREFRSDVLAVLNG